MGFLVGSASPRPWLGTGSTLLPVFRYGFRRKLGFLALGIVISLVPQSPLRDVLTSLKISLSSAFVSPLQPGGMRRPVTCACAVGFTHCLQVICVVPIWALALSLL